MATTYDTSIGTEKDWVRLRIGDTNSAKMYLTDEEIDDGLWEVSFGTVLLGHADQHKPKLGLRHHDPS